MLNKGFKTLAMGTALALSAAFAAPAMAGKDFVRQDLRGEETTVVELVGASLSKDKLTFVVHGGNKNLMMAAYRVAQRLDDENVPVAFLLAPDRDGSPITMHVDYYANGGTKYYVTAYDNDNISVEQTEADLYGQAMKAYTEGFAQAGKKPQTEDVIAVALN